MALQAAPEALPSPRIHVQAHRMWIAFPGGLEVDISAQSLRRSELLSSVYDAAEQPWNSPLGVAPLALQQWLKHVQSGTLTKHHCY